MTTTIDTTQTFQQRMFTKIQESMGDLMTHEDLKRIVEAAVHESFFKERKTNGYYDSPKTSLFIELIQKELKPQVALAAKEWMTDHKDEVTRAINEELGKGFFGIVKDYIGDRISNDLNNIKNTLQNI